MTDTVVVEGQVKFRDGKKVYKDKRREKEKNRHRKEKVNVTLEEICGLEPGPGYDGVAYSLSILCLAYSVALGFHSREALAAWDARIRHSLGEVHRFSVNVQPGTKLECGPASLHLCNDLLVLTRDFPPVVAGQWKLSELRRYGAVPNGFVFEGGTRCGYWTGVFFLSCLEGEQISFLFDCIVRGISPSRTPHGLRPALPVDPSSSPSSLEERINREASVLEKRLSMLSHCSRPISSASSYSCSTVAGDDHSSMSSSSSSQSDTSFGSRLLMWADATTATSHLSVKTVSSSPALKSSARSDERLFSASVGSSAVRSSSKQLHPPGLQLQGSRRQSSVDSGLGTASGSQSSGSFSSCTSSLDATSQGGAEEFGSQASLPSPSVPHPPSTPVAPPPLPVVFSPASSSFSSRPTSADSSVSLVHGDEYQIPNILRLRYDTPRSLKHSLALRDTLALDPLAVKNTLTQKDTLALKDILSIRDNLTLDPLALKDTLSPMGTLTLRDSLTPTDTLTPAAPLALPGRPLSGKDRQSLGVGGKEHGRGVSKVPTGLSLQEAGGQHHVAIQRSPSRGSETAPPVEVARRLNQRPFLFAESPVHEGLQCSHASDNYVTPEQWRRGLAELTNSPLSQPIPTSDCSMESKEEVQRVTIGFRNSLSDFGNPGSSVRRSTQSSALAPTNPVPRDGRSTEPSLSSLKLEGSDLQLSFKLSSTDMVSVTSRSSVRSVTGQQASTLRLHQRPHEPC